MGRLISLSLQARHILAGAPTHIELEGKDRHNQDQDDDP